MHGFSRFLFGYTLLYLLTGLLFNGEMMLRHGLHGRLHSGGQGGEDDCRRFCCFIILVISYVKCGGRSNE